jgi:hypothetical protein|tara:strand:+ start:15993 stop:16268 length:276 start_codon:yes stop_codon:yes gene_type:complete
MAKKKVTASADFLDDAIGAATTRPKEKAPAQSKPTVKAVTTSDKKREYEQMNIKVYDGFKKEFQLWCMRHDMSMREAIEEAYELLRKKHGA